MYDKMTFAPYVFREYPKMITLPSGEQRVVESQYEEILARGENPADHGVVENPVARENMDLKARLDEQQKQIDMLLSRLDKTPVPGSVSSSGEKLSSNTPILPSNQSGTTPGEKLAAQLNVPTAPASMPAPGPSVPDVTPAPAGKAIPGEPGGTVAQPLANPKK